jgi:hypothetical protein
MMSLGGWMNEVLIGWGIDPRFAEIYFFSRNKVWKEYERIQSDISTICWL